MKLIVLSRPSDFKGEMQILHSLFEAGLQSFHLRKPEASPSELQTYLSQLSRQWYPRIVLHQHWEVAEALGLGGIHIPEWKRQQLTAEEWQRWVDKAHAQQLTISTSVHEMSTLDELDGLDYVFLSPVFPSISKPGYGPTTHLSVEKRYPFEVYALGGIDLSKMEEVAERGFDGAALLGAIWREPHNAKEVFLEAQRTQTLVS